MWRRGVLAGFALAIWLLAAAMPAQAAFPGQNGKIAFYSDRDGNYEIYTMNPDGTSFARLTNNPGHDLYPAWAPDGSKIVFQSSREDPNPATCHPAACVNHLYAMNADGSGEEKLTLTPSTERCCASWSPDGTRLVFADRGFPSSGARDIFTLGLSDGIQTNLTSTFSVDENDPAWSPDGEQIASSTYPCPNPGSDVGIQVMNADGSGATCLTEFWEFAPNWSPDSSRIAFDTDRWIDEFMCDCEDIVAIDRDGSGGTQLTSTFTKEMTPAWSPDGTKIAFYANRDGNGEIYVMNADGTGQTNITNSPASREGLPDWQPVPYQSSPAPTYDHPRFASPATVSLVPNYRQTISNSQCTSRGGVNSNHGPPLAFASCNPPGFVPGTRAFFGPSSDSRATYAVIYGDTDPGNGDQANMTLHASLNDIRTSAGSDYPADLTLDTKLRITDRHNGGSQSDPATVQDFETLTPVTCTATAGPQGSACNLDSSLDAQTPGAIQENKGTVVQVFRFRVNDSGANGTRGDGDDRTFAVQGIYIP